MLHDRHFSIIAALRVAAARLIKSPVVLIVTLPILIFGRALLPGRVLSPADILFSIHPWHALDPSLVPKNSLLADQMDVFQPWLIYSIAEISNGRFPLWNPHSFAGAPLLGNGQSALLFPLTWLAYVLPLHTALGAIAILKITGAGLSMYWMLRVLALQPLAATAGALAFMFNSFLIVWLGWPLSSVGMWLPLLVGLTERLRLTLKWRDLAYLAVIICIQFLAGHPETSFHVLFVTGCYALYRARGEASGRFLAQFVAAGLLGALIAAVQLLPLFEYLAHGAILLARHRGSYNRTLSLHTFIVLLIPNYFGNPTSRNSWGPGNYNELSGFVGLIPWILAPCALLTGSTRRGINFFLGMAIFSAAAVYGLWPIPWVLSWLPGFSMAANGRLILALAFSMATLGAIGLDVLLEVPSELRSRIAIVVKMSFLIIVAISFCFLAFDSREFIARGITHYVAIQWIVFFVLLCVATFATLRLLGSGSSGRTWAMALLGIEFLSFLPFVSNYNPIIDTKQFYPVPDAFKYLGSDKDLFRVFLPVPNIGAVYNLSDITGYDAITPVYLAQLLNGVLSLGAMGNGVLWFWDDLNSPLSNLVNLKYVLSPAGVASPGPRFNLVYDGPDARIFRNSGVFPRAFLARRARSCMDDDASLAIVRAGKLNLLDEVIISGCHHLPASDLAQATPEVELYEPERVIVHADVQGSAFLVLTDSYDPGWQVQVDGHAAPLLRADYAFRGVALGPGSHQVEFLYRPLSLRAGVILSIAGLILTAILLATVKDRVCTIPLE